MTQAREVPIDYMQAIGRVIVEWGVMERMLDLTLVKLCGTEIDEGRSFIPFAHMAFPQKLDALSALVHEVSRMSKGFERLVPALDRSKPLLKKAQEGRNRVVHSTWGVEEDGTVTIINLKARGVLKTTVEPIRLDEVSAVSTSIKRALESLYELLIGRTLEEARSASKRTV